MLKFFINNLIRWTNPLTVFIVANLLVALLRLYGSLVYPDLSIEAQLVLVGYIIFFIAGYAVIYNMKRKHSSGQKENSEFNNFDAGKRMLFNILCFLSLMCILASLYRFIDEYGMQFTRVTEIRYEAMGESQGIVKTSGIGIMVVLLSGFPYLLTIMGIMYFKQLTFSGKVFFSVLIPVSSFVFTLSGGRNSLFFIVLCIIFTVIVKLKIISYSFCYTRKNIKLILILTCVMISFFIYSSAIFSQRSNDVRNMSFDEHLYLLTDGIASVQPSPNEHIAVLKFYQFYLTHAVNEFDYLLQEDVDLFWGCRTFYLVAAFLNKLGCNFPGSVEVLSALPHSGFYNGLAGCLLMDFGIVGLLIAMFVQGMISATVYIRVMDGTFKSVFVLVYLFMVVVVSPIYSGFTIGNGFAILISLILLKIYFVVTCKRECVTNANVSSEL